MVVRAIPVVESEVVPATAVAQTLRRSRTASAGSTGGSGGGPITCHDDLQTSVDGGDIAHDDTDKIPVKSLRDDIQRKTSLKKVMGPNPDEKGGKLNKPDESEGGPGSGRHPGGGKGQLQHGIGKELRRRAKRADKELQGIGATMAQRVSMRNMYADALAKHEMGRAFPKASEAVQQDFSGDPLGMADDSTDEDLAPDSDQHTKEEVNYRYSGDKVQSCGNCVHFQFPGACEIVAGLMRPVDVCDEFEAVENDQPSGVFKQSDVSDEIIPGEDAADEEGEDSPEMQGGYKKLRDNTVQSVPVVQAVAVEGGPASQFGMIANEVSPPGWSGTVKAMKKHPKISNPFALAYWMRDQGDTSHYKPEKTTEVGWTDAARAAALIARQRGYEGKPDVLSKGAVLTHPEGHRLYVGPRGNWEHYGAIGSPSASGTNPRTLSTHLDQVHGASKTSESLIRRLAKNIAHVMEGGESAANPLVTGGPGSGRRAGDVAVGGINPDAVRMHIRDPKKNTAMCGHRGSEPAVAQGMPTSQQLDKVSCPGCLNKYAGRMYRTDEQEEGGPGSGRHKFAPEQPQSAEDKQIDKFTRREKPAERAARIAGQKVDPAAARAVRKYFAQAMLVEEHRPDYGTYVIPPIDPEQKHASEIREYSPDQPRDRGRWTAGGGSKGKSGGKSVSATGKPLNKGAQRAKDLAQTRKSGQQQAPQPVAQAPAKPSGPLNKGAQRAQMVGQARKDVHAAHVDKATNDRIVANLRQMGFFNTEVESEAVYA